MKKRTPIIITALVAAFTLLTVTAFAGAPTYEGYEAFKDLATSHEDKEMEDKNGTFTGALRVTDNNEVIAEFEGQFKADGEESGSGTFTLTSNGITKDIEVYSDGEYGYFVDTNEDTYYVIDKEEMETYHEDTFGEDYDEDYYGRRGSKSVDGDMTPAQEELLDFIVGDLKDDFVLTNNGDGTETIAFEMTEDEMPMLLNLIVSAADDRVYEEQEEMVHDFSDELLAKYPVLADMVAMEVDIPEIVDNSSIEKVAFELTTDENDQPLALSFDFIVSGDDADGVYHTLQVTGEFSGSNIGTTVVDTLNVDGMTEINIDPEDFEGMYDDEMNARSGRKNRR